MRWLNKSLVLCSVLRGSISCGRRSAPWRNPAKGRRSSSSTQRARTRCHANPLGRTWVRTVTPTRFPLLRELGCVGAPMLGGGDLAARAMRVARPRSPPAVGPLDANYTNARNPLAICRLRWAVSASIAMKANGRSRRQDPRRGPVARPGRDRRRDRHQGLVPWGRPVRGARCPGQEWVPGERRSCDQVYPTRHRAASPEGSWFTGTGGARDSALDRGPAGEAAASGSSIDQEA
jgi:hypothetical protein